MNKTLKPGSRSGRVNLPSSKSIAHRYLICSALTKGENQLKINGFSEDIKATVSCLASLFGNAHIKDGVAVLSDPQLSSNETVTLDCFESGTTLRFIMPLVGVFGKNAVFKMCGRLSERPVTHLAKTLCDNGMIIEKKGDKLYCGGRLHGGKYCLPGNVSSQYISALLFSLPLLPEDSTLTVTGDIQSSGYIALTKQALTLSGIEIKQRGDTYYIKGNQSYRFPANHSVEGDWSGASAFICMGAFSKKGITLLGLDADSLQGDRKLLDIVRECGADVIVNENGITVKKGELCSTAVNVSDIPDVAPCLAAMLAMANGKSEITNAARLKLKESDRLLCTEKTLRALGADIKATNDSLEISGTNKLKGGKAETFGDHRIAMAAAVAASGCEKEVIIDNAECTNKSYVGFWRDFDGLEVENGF